MVKIRGKSRRKNHRGLESEDLSNAWEEEVAPLGRRLASVTKKLLVSIFKLLGTSVLILVGHCRRALALIGQLILNTWLWIFRLFQSICLAAIRTYKKFVGLCRRAIEAVKQRIIKISLKTVRHYHRVRIATKRTVRSFAALYRREAKAVKQQIITISLKTVRHYHRVRIATKRTVRSFAALCHHAAEAVKQQIITINLKTVRQYRRIRIGTIRVYKTVALRIEASYQKLHRQYRLIRILMIRTRRSLVRYSRQTIEAAKFKLVSTGLKTVRRYHRMRIATGRANIWFVRFCRQSVAAAQRQIILASQKMVRGCRQVRLASKQAYQPLVFNYRGYVGTISRKERAVNRNFKRQYLRTLVRTRRAFLNCIKLWHRGIKSFRRGLRFAQLKAARRYLRALIIVRRAFRNFIRQYRQVRAAARDSIEASRQTVLKQYQETIQATNQIDSALELEAKKDQRALALARKQMTSSWKNAAKQVRNKIDDIGHQVSTSFQAAGEWVSKSKPQKFLEPVAACVKKATQFSEYKKVKKVGALHSTWVPFKQIRSFFSGFAQKLPIRDRIAKSNGLKILLDLGLIIGVSFYVLIITYLVNSKYKSFNPLNSPSIALGKMNSGSGISINQPPLALIPYSPEPKLAAAPAQYQQTESRGYSFWPKRITLRHVEGWGEGVSFGTDYSTLALLFAPDYRVGRIMPMLDLRGHRFDNNTYAANIGIAARYIPGSNPCCHNNFCQILGFNVFWDWREGRLGSFQQIGAGLEVLGKRWDLRANVYAPISVKKRRLTCKFDDYEGGYYAIHRQCEFTSYGYNAEIGYYVIRGCDFFLYAAVGPYYLVRKCHDHTRGGEFRLRPQYKDYLALDFSVSYDNVFKTVYQAQVILYLPLYQLSKCLNKWPCGLSDQQIYQPIERFEVMPLGRRSCWQRNF